MSTNGRPSDLNVDGYIEYSFTTGCLPWSESEEFVVEVKGQITGAVEQDERIVEENANIGEMELWLVLIHQAMNDRRRLFDVFEGHSDLLESVHAAIFEPDGYETRSDLDIEPTSSNLLYLRSIEVEPRYRQSSIVTDSLETAIETLCPGGIVVTDPDELGLLSKEIFLLSLSKLPGTDFVFRDTCRINPHREQLDD